jgi:hypothetical protein
VAKGGLSPDTTNFIVKIVFVILAIAILYILVRRHPGFIDWLKGLTGGSFVGAAAIGASVPGPNIYTNLGDIPRSGPFGLSEASGGTSFRDNVSFPCDKCARETTWFVVPGNPGEGGMDLSIKMGSHGGGNDNGALISFSQIPIGGSGGKWACEGPHGNDQDVSGGSGSVELGGAQKIGIKGISWNVGGDTEHHEIWYNADGTGGTWTKMAEFEGQSNCNPLACPVPSGEDDAHCQDTLRIDDNSGHQFISRSIVEIDPAPGAVGGGTEPTPTPTSGETCSGAGGGGEDTEPPAGEEPEEKEPDDEEEEELEEEEEFHPKPITAKMITITKKSAKNPHLALYYYR